MKLGKWLLVVCTLIFLAAAVPASAATPGAEDAAQPWVIQTLKSAEPGLLNLSTAFVTPAERPMLSYSKTSTNYIYRAYPALPNTTGNCGVGSSWVCASAYVPNLVAGTLSPMDVWQKDGSFVVGWAYSTGTKIQVKTIEFNDDMTYKTSNTTDLLKVGIFGDVLIGTPAFQFDQQSGQYSIAVTFRSSSQDTYPYRLVHIGISAFSDTTCLGVGYPLDYHCEMVDMANGGRVLSAPSFQRASDRTAGIAYRKSGNEYGLMFAYQQPAGPSVPATCGSGTIIWRCISIYPEASPTVIGGVIKGAVGRTPSNRAIAYTIQNATSNMVMQATFVSGGGNCGTDLNGSGNSVFMWKCNVIPHEAGLQRSFSIAVDPQGYSIIAYTDILAVLAPMDLYLSYPNMRVGRPGNEWQEQAIDGAPTTAVTTGGQVSLSLNSFGLGFLAYLQEEDYSDPDLKVAWQVSRLNLPLLQR